ncbi:hypothetical protein AC249_AIPGENE20526 [Exaiptasia diaphana]|nr:hypothetical protein AC249_AIPGENE20526 [Exaiptasia diaphana]
MFPSKGDDYLKLCTFAFIPIPKGANAKENCKSVLETPHIGIPGHKWRPDKQPLMKKSQNTKCIALNFINNAGVPFKITSSLKRQEYLVTDENMRLKAIIKRPELHRHVVFRAKDPENKFILNIEGDPSIIVTPSYDCNKYVSVRVTAKPAKPPVHYHYHYHNASQGTYP